MCSVYFYISKYQYNNRFSAGPIYFCKKLRKAGVSLTDSNAMGALYMRQVAKVKKTVASMHEDLQSDYEQISNICSYKCIKIK